MANEDIDLAPDESQDEPLTLGEVFHDLLKTKAPRDWIGKRADLWFKERRHRVALERLQDQRRFRLARQQLWAGVGLAVAVLGCLTALVATEALPKDAALPLFGAIVGALFSRGRSNS